MAVLFVQQNSVANANNCTFPSAVAVGDLIFVFGLFGSGFINVTDTLGNPTYTTLTTRAAGNGLTSFVAYCYSQFAGACTVHINGSASNYYGIAEYSGLINGLAPVVFNGDTGNSFVIDCGGFSAPSTDLLLLMTGQVWNIGTTYTQSAGYTKRIDNGTIGMADSVVNAVGAQNPTLTISVSQSWNGIGIAFLPLPPSSSIVTVPGTACPWAFRGTGVDNPGTAHSTAGGFAAGFNDGSTAGGASVGQNLAYPYGSQHTSPAGETNPITVACVPGRLIVLSYINGLIQTQGGGAGNSDPTGSSGSTELSLGPNETDSNGYNYPVNFVSGSTTKIGGLCGCFTDSGGNVIAGSFWDWAARGGTGSANSSISLVVPVGAAFLSMGIIDTILRDNTGSFVMSTVSIDGLFVGIDGGWFADTGYFIQYPAGQVTPAALRDQTNLSGTNLKATVLLSVYWMPQTDLGASLLGRFGQMFPHGGQQAGNSPAGVGQNFPY